MRELIVRRKAHRRKSHVRDVKPGPGVKRKRVKGAEVKGSTFRIKDRGKSGRTPKSERWYEPKVKMNWGKDMAIATRRRNALKAHKGDELATARALLALSNVTTDRPTAREARKDALFFFAKHRGNK